MLLLAVENVSSSMVGDIADDRWSLCTPADEYSCCDFVS